MIRNNEKGEKISETIIKRNKDGIRVSSKTVDVEGVLRREVTYNEEGLRDKIVRYKKDGETVKSSTKFNRQEGKLISKRTIDRNGNLRREVSFNEIQKPSETRLYDKEENLLSITKVDYDSDNHR